MSTAETTAGFPAGEFGEKQQPTVEAGIPAQVEDAVAVNGLAGATTGRSIFDGYEPAPHIYRPPTPNERLVEAEQAALRAADNEAAGRF